MKLYVLTSVWVLTQTGAVVCFASEKVCFRLLWPLLLNRQEHFLVSLKMPLLHQLLPSGVHVFLCFHWQLSIWRSSPQMANLLFFLHHLVLTQVYFGIITSVKGTGSFKFFFFLFCLGFVRLWAVDNVYVLDLTAACSRVGVDMLSIMTANAAQRVSCYAERRH